MKIPRNWRKETFKGSNEQWYFRWKNASGEIVLVGGEGYATKSSANRAAKHALQMLDHSQTVPRDLGHP